MTSLDRVPSRMMSSFEQDARIEGVLTRLETHELRQDQVE
jgi:hypothetical protein